MSPTRWISEFNAIGIKTKPTKNGGTFAHRDIALEFASWISPEIKLYIIKEFQRLKIQESEQLEWHGKRMLTKLNYLIHTDAIKEFLLPIELTKDQMNFIYKRLTRNENKENNNEKLEEQKQYLSYNDFKMSLLLLTIMTHLNNKDMKITEEDYNLLNEILI